MRGSSSPPSPWERVTQVRDIHMGYQIKSFNSADIVKLFSAENLSKSAKVVGCEAVITFGEIIFKSLDSRL